MDRLSNQITGFKNLINLVKEGLWELIGGIRLLLRLKLGLVPWLLEHTVQFLASRKD